MLRGVEPFDAWCRLRERDGESVGVLELYELAGRSRGLRAHELPIEERERLSRLALPVLFPGHQVTGDDRTDPIELAPYDDAWPAAFARWHEALLGGLGAVAIRIEHVGSTAVPGLLAKPVVDIQVSVSDQADEPAYVPAIEAVGVQLRARDEEHRYFRPFPGRPREVHVHVCSAGSRWEHEHLLFRDYLRADPATRDAYADVKRQAAAVWHDDRVAYTDAKGALIRETLRAAEEWAAHTGWRPGR